MIWPSRNGLDVLMPALKICARAGQHGLGQSLPRRHSYLPRGHRPAGDARADFATPDILHTVNGVVAAWRRHFRPYAAEVRLVKRIAAIGAARTWSCGPTTYRKPADWERLAEELPGLKSAAMWTHHMW